MSPQTRATLLYFYLATQPFVWINNTGSVRIKWLLSNDYLRESGRRARLTLTEKAKSYCYQELSTRG